MVPRGQDCPNVLVTRNRQDIHRPLSESRSCEVSLNMDLDMDEDMLPTSPPPPPPQLAVRFKRQAEFRRCQKIPVRLKDRIPMTCTLRC